MRRAYRLRGGYNRLSVLAVCLVWPLIWVGGLVTTFDAGMAVPDWPATYGYNLFLYPYQTWLLGPFDLFIEHGHRLLAAVVGMVAIALWVTAIRTEPRRWVVILAAVLLAAVIIQGVLGGMRVVLGDRTLAMFHGCFGPAFFALCVVAAAVTSRLWWNSSASENSAGIGLTRVGLAGTVVVISYGQLVLGAQLRHVQPAAPPGQFAMIVALHIVTAFLLWLLTGVTWLSIRRCGDLTLSRPGRWLIGFVGFQIVLGIATWVVNYGWPSFLQWMPGATGYLLVAKGFSESIIVTAHVATGALILALGTLLLVRLVRLRYVRQHSAFGAGSQQTDDLPELAPAK